MHYFTTMTPVSMKPLSTSSKVYNSNKTILQVPYEIDFNIRELHAFTMICADSSGQELRIGFDENKNAFFVDRSKAGKSDFDTHFAAIHYAPRIARSKGSTLTVILDNSSVELFADGGLTCMTDIFFPAQPLSEWRTESNKAFFDSVHFTPLRSIWPSH